LNPTIEKEKKKRAKILNPRIERGKRTKNCTKLKAKFINL
jgi:hypothetical protein